MKTALSPPLVPPAEDSRAPRAAKPTDKTTALEREIEERRRIFEASLDLILVVDRKGNFLEVSPSSVKILGYQPEDMIGRSAADFVYPDDLDRTRAEMRGARRGRELRNFEARYVHKNGRAAPLQWNGVWSEPERRYFFIGRDLEESRFAERMFRLAVESCPSGMVSVNEAGNIVLVNSEVERQFGYRREELIGQPVELLLPDRLRGRHIHHRADYTRLPKPRHLPRELFGIRKDGTEFPVEIALNPIQTREGLLVLCAVVDITERKQAEALLLEKMAELNRSNEELAQFAYIASHDLQEPLRMVASYTQLLQRRYRGRLDADADEFIAFAVDGASRMQRLIQDLLTYSRVGARGLALQDVSSEKVLARALKNLRGAIEESGAEVTHDSLPDVHADEVQLVQLLQNLVGNAIKYQSSGNPKIHLSAARNAEMKWEFSVQDNGIGIEPQHFEKIFGMFQRLHGRGEFAGTGIGLAICKKIVERHGGSITVESQPGQGSTFRFTMMESEIQPASEGRS